MKLEADSDVVDVLEFMQGRVAAEKLVAVADSLPALARLLWFDETAKPRNLLTLTVNHPTALVSDQ